MQYVLYAALVAVIFGLVALCDLLLKKTVFRNQRRYANAVRMPRYSCILGLIMALIGVIGVLYIPRSEGFLWFGCWLVLIMGVYLLTNYCWFGIYYDETGFTYRTLGKPSRTYRYGEITGQRTFVAKSGWNSQLYARGEEIHLYAAMQGLSDFLNKAFFAWCRETGADPDTVENDPHNLIFFPDPEKTE